MSPQLFRRPTSSGPWPGTSFVLGLEPVEITESGDVRQSSTAHGHAIPVRERRDQPGHCGRATRPRCRGRGLAVQGPGALFEEYDFGEVFRTVDGIATDAVGQKMAWLKEPEGNILSVGTR